MCKHNFLRASLLCVAVLMVACTATPVTPPAASCDLPSSKDMAKAFQEAYATLSKKGCQSSSRLDEVEEQLLNLAADNRGARNKDHFDEFYYRISNSDFNLLTRRQAVIRLKSYFSIEFKTVLLDYNDPTCQEVRGKGLDEIEETMLAALDKKERGLVEVLGGQDQWELAKLRYSNLIETLDAVKRAGCD